MIEFDQVSKKYGDVEAIDNISFTIPEGEIWVLIGPSGCGKSTTLKMVNRMLEATAGSIYIHGSDVTSLPPETLRRKIGYVIQDIGLFPHFTVVDNIGIVPKLLGWKKERRKERGYELLELIGLHPEEYARKYPHELSGGEAQRIGVARSLAADPPILLMDEPFGAVDPLNRDVLQREFLSLHRKLKKTVLFVTHDLDEAIRIGDQIVLMKNGHIEQMDKPETILSLPKNRFVKNFVGADRALKMLARYEVRDRMEPSGTIFVTDFFTQELYEKHKNELFLWAVDSNNYLKGWIDMVETDIGKPVKDIMTPILPKDICINQNSSLKIALSRMLGQGIQYLPVINDNWHLIGQINMREIEKITDKGDFSW